MEFNALGGGQPSCDAAQVSVFPDVGWGQAVSSCGPLEENEGGGEPCDAVADGVCWPPIPQGFDAQLCVWATGDLQCPAGSPYQSRQLPL